MEVKLGGPNKLREKGKKFTRVYGEKRNAYLLAIIDCLAADIVGSEVGYSLRNEEDVWLVGEAHRRKN